MFLFGAKQYFSQEYCFFGIFYHNVGPMNRKIIVTINFFKSDFSDDLQSWGVLGDYIGGVLNPVISLITLCALGT